MFRGEGGLTDGPKSSRSLKAVGEGEDVPFTGAVTVAGLF